MPTNPSPSATSLGWSVVTCKHRGYEWTLYDHREVDGPMRSICVGIVGFRQCFQYLGGPRVDRTR